MKHENWTNFVPGVWQDTINVRDFIQQNYKPYTGDADFLSGPTERTSDLMGQVQALFAKERRKGGVLDIDVDTVSSLTSYAPGYIDKDKELIVGLQTDKPLKRGVNPFGGIRMARQACTAYGYRLSDKVEDEFRYRTTHNDGVFRVYTEEMRKARKCHVITGLPDAYGRGRIIGDYRRVALYGVDRLIEEKLKDKKNLDDVLFHVDNARLAEELFRQITFLGYMKDMAAMYGYDISQPAGCAREAIQWTYFAYLAAIKEQNGAAMSLGRVSTFFDIYIERDMAAGILDEAGAQELMDDFVMKLRLARHLRTPEYNELFGGDPMWITEAVGGMGTDGRTLVTKNCFRMLNTLYTLGSSPEPNLTILWAQALPEGWKRFCAKVSADTDSIQYENDDLMRPHHGDDYAIACCVSAMELGKQMQFFGARCNLAKLLLIAINGGYDTTSGMHIGPQMPVMEADTLSYDAVVAAVPKWWEMTSRDPAFPFWPMIPTGWNDIPRSFEQSRVIYGRSIDKFRKICADDGHIVFRFGNVGRLGIFNNFPHLHLDRIGAGRGLSLGFDIDPQAVPLLHAGAQAVLRDRAQDIREHARAFAQVVGIAAGETGSADRHMVDAAHADELFNWRFNLHLQRDRAGVLRLVALLRDHRVGDLERARFVHQRAMRRAHAHRFFVQKHLFQGTQGLHQQLHGVTLPLYSAALQQHFQPFHAKFLFQIARPVGKQFHIEQMLRRVRVHAEDALHALLRCDFPELLTRVAKALEPALAPVQAAQQIVFQRHVHRLCRAADLPRHVLCMPVELFVLAQHHIRVRHIQKLAGQHALHGHFRVFFQMLRLGASAKVEPAAGHIAVVGGIVMVAQNQIIQLILFLLLHDPAEDLREILAFQAAQHADLILVLFARLAHLGDIIGQLALVHAHAGNIVRRIVVRGMVGKTEQLQSSGYSRFYVFFFASRGVTA